MIRKRHNHILQNNPRCLEEEYNNYNSNMAFITQQKQRNQLSLPW